MVSRLPARTYRLMTWNVHHCVGMDRLHSPVRIAQVIREYDPDIVALQELEVNHHRSDRIHQPHLIADLLGMQFHYHPPRIQGDAGFGNAVFTRLPVLHSMRMGLLPGHRMFRLQKRGAIWASIDVDGHPLQIINTHFGLLGWERLLQARALCGPGWLDHPDCRTRPSIVCGDFNATPRSRTYRLLAGALRDAQRLGGDPGVRTWPSPIPMLRYDHVFVGHGIRVRRIEVPRTRWTALSSDHLPVLLEFEMAVDPSRQ